MVQNEAQSLVLQGLTLDEVLMLIEGLGQRKGSPDCRNTSAIAENECGFHIQAEELRCRY